MRVQSINLNLIPVGVMPVLHFSQFDRDVDGSIIYMIYNGAVPFDLTDCEAVLEGTKPDSTVFSYPCTVHNNFLTTPTYSQMTSVLGDYAAEIRISKDGSVVGTLNFTISVEAGGIGSADLSDTEIPALLDDIQNAVDEAEYWAEQAASAVTGVSSFNGRSGSVLPMAGDYSAEQVDYDSNQTVKQKIDALQNQLNAQGVLGAKNLLQNTATSQTIYGVTFTVNSDGTVTANGTCNTGGQSGVYCQLYINIGMNLDTDKRYILSGCPINDIGAILQHSSWTAGGEFVNDTGNGVEYNGYDAQQYPNNRVLITIPNGKTANNLVFKPMLRLASDPDDTYQPYAMTNRELTNGKADKTDVDSNIDELKSYLGILTTPVPSYVANTLPVLRRNITSAFYNGSLRGEIAAGNFKNVRPGDYIIGQASGSTYYVAMCDYRLGKGNQTNDTHHLGLMLFKPVGTTALWRGYGNSNRSWRVVATDLGRCPWNAALDADPANTEAVGADNTNITRTYGSANVSGYMGSFIRERIDAILLPQCFQADFGSANVLKYREINGNAVAIDKPGGGQGNWNGCTSGWGWYDRYLDLPSEVELYGSRIFGSGMDTGCQCEQLPLFRNAAIYDFYPRIDIWTKGVASSSEACRRNTDGSANCNSASNAAWACPLACVK